MSNPIPKIEPAKLVVIAPDDGQVSRRYVGGVFLAGNLLLQVEQVGPAITVTMLNSLFEQVAVDTWMCRACGELDSMKADYHDSFGGTTEYSVECTKCEAAHGWADLSAVI